jgi:hypothetical protein
LAFWDFFRTKIKDYDNKKCIWELKIEIVTSNLNPKKILLLIADLIL